MANLAACVLLACAVAALAQVTKLPLVQVRVPGGQRRHPSSASGEGAEPLAAAVLGGWRRHPGSSASEGASSQTALELATARQAAALQTLLATSVGNVTAEQMVSLKDTADLFYTLRMQLGTPAKSVTMVVDTGSSDLWVRKGIYDCGKSSSAKCDVRSVHLQYGIGKVDGELGFDDARLGALTLPQASVVVGTPEGVGNALFFDGLIGLAFPALAKTGSETFLQALMARGPYKKMAFALALHGSGKAASSLDIGELNDVLAGAPEGGKGGVRLQSQHDMLFMSEGPATFWMANMKVSLRLPGSNVLLDTRGIFDSGTSYVAVPQLQFLMILGSIGHSCMMLGAQLLCDCNVDLAPITLTFDGAEALQGGRAGSPRSLEVTLAKEDLLSPVPGVPVCRLALMAAPTAYWILGDVLLRKVYTVHVPAEEALVVFPQPGAGARTGPPASALLDQPASSAFSFVSLAGCSLAAAVAMALLTSTALSWFRRIRERNEPLLASESVAYRPL
eukprot:TRINITY_DN56393_c0_g1_i1.p1 TRINITY_DN56393_c0_g1~~TRINITY_DN56393_c0_g1_i1.p1  ORF type:complete len:506 (+),score=117.77 TRINITY_DN56393_c0_g1_i1:69-1586(+)